MDTQTVTLITTTGEFTGLAFKIFLTNDIGSLTIDESNFFLSHHAFKSCVNHTPSVAFSSVYWKGNVFFQWMNVDLPYLPDSVDRGVGCFQTDQSSET